MKNNYLFFLITLICLINLYPKLAFSQVCGPQTCLEIVNAREPGNWANSIASVLDYLEREFNESNGQRKWWNTFFENQWKPAFQGMAAQLSAVSMQQAQIFGTFLDAKHQLETQQLLQRLTARAHKEYQPSNGICEFGSGIKSLAASERKGELAALVLARRSIDRGLGRKGTLGGTGSQADMPGRIDQYKKTFCDPQDNNNGLATLCGAGAAKKENINRDVDFVRTLGGPLTLKADFTNGAVDESGDEESILALAANLYGSSLKNLQNVTGSENVLAHRAFIAKRNVAENSYNALAAMKAAGTAGSQKYLAKIVEDLGVKPEDAKKMLGDNPSYYAQMEVLTKKIYQNPDFYTNLYDTPVNVARKGVAIQALNLMQKFDLFKSNLRNEASLSILLELAVSRDLKPGVQNNQKDATD